jgi:hypothetical protein
MLFCLMPVFETMANATHTGQGRSAGELDGHEIAMDGSDGFMYIYGPSADRLFEVIEPVLKATDFMQGAKAQLRYGPPESTPRKKP